MVITYRKSQAQEVDELFYKQKLLLTSKRTHNVLLFYPVSQWKRVFVLLEWSV